MRKVKKKSGGGCCPFPLLSSMSIDGRDGHRSSRTMSKLTLSLSLSLQADSGPRGASRERLGGEGNLPQEKGGPSVPAHLLGNPYAFGLTPGAVMQDSRFQPLR